MTKKKNTVTTSHTRRMAVTLAKGEDQFPEQQYVQRNQPRLHELPESNHLLPLLIPPFQPFPIQPPSVTSQLHAMELQLPSLQLLSPHQSFNPQEKEHPTEATEQEFTPTMMTHSTTIILGMPAVKVPIKLMELIVKTGYNYTPLPKRKEAITSVSMYSNNLATKFGTAAAMSRVAKAVSDNMTATPDSCTTSNRIYNTLQDTKVKTFCILNEISMADKGVGVVISPRSLRDDFKRKEIMKDGFQIRGCLINSYHLWKRKDPEYKKGSFEYIHRNQLANWGSFFSKCEWAGRRRPWLAQKYHPSSKRENRVLGMEGRGQHEGLRWRHGELQR